MRQDLHPMILAAGYGTRLRPLTDRRAKSVVPFLNRPVLDYLLDWLYRCGFRETVINLHHAVSTVRRRYGREARGMRIDYSVEERLLGTAGGPRAVIDRLGETALIVNGDIVTGAALGPLVERHRGSQALATLGLYGGDTAQVHESVALADDGAILGFSSPAGAEERLCFAGIHVVERRALEAVPSDRPCGFVEPLYREILEAGLPIHGVILGGPWYEIGTLDAYRRAQLMALAREDMPLAFEGYRRVGSGAYLKRSVRVDRAGVEPPFLLADGVRIADGAVAVGVVAGRRVRIGPGAEVRRSVLLGGATIGPGARVEDAIVTEGAHVPAGIEVRDRAWTGEAAGSVAAGSAPAR